MHCSPPAPPLRCGVLATLAILALALANYTLTVLQGGIDLVIFGAFLTLSAIPLGLARHQSG